MSHDQGRPTGCQGEGGPLHHGLGGRIQGHGGLIQQQNVGVNQTRPGQCEQLQLTGGQIAPTRGDLMQVPVVECGDHRMGTDLPRSPFDLGIGGIGPSVCDGIADRPGEDVLLLRHDAEPVAIAVDIELPQVASVDSDRPMGRIVEPRHQLDQGGFPGSGGADEHHRLPGRNSQVDAGQCRHFSCSVGIVDGVENHFTTQRPHRSCRRRRRCPRAQQRPDPPGRHRRTLVIVEHLRQFAYRRVQQLDVEQIGHQRSDRDHPRSHLACTVEQDQGGRQAAEQCHERVVQG